MSLLTKEQAAHVAYMRDLYCGPSGYDEIDELVCIIDDLQARAHRGTAEIDKELPQEMLGVRFDAKLADAWDSELDSYELSCYFAERARRAEARAPKQYTEQELREAFEDAKGRDPVFDEEVERNDHGEYKDRMVEVAWYNYQRCARFLGALKAEP